MERVVYPGVVYRARVYQGVHLPYYTPRVHPTVTLRTPCAAGAVPCPEYSSFLLWEASSLLWEAWSQR